MVTRQEAISWMRGEIRLLRMGQLVNNGWVNPDWQKEIEIFEMSIAALEREENTMENIIQEGIDNAPSEGLNELFYPRMFCASREDWARALKEAGDLAGAAVDCAALYRAKNGLPDDGNYGPTGAVRVIQQNGYDYLFYIDSRGDWNSVAFRAKGA